MSRPKTRTNDPNNSGKFRQPTNVWICLDSHDASGDLVVIQSVYTEFELQSLAEDYPQWIIFVKE